MKVVLLLVALLAALASVHGETKTLTTVGATSLAAGASPTVTAITSLNTTSRVTTLNVTNVTANVTISGTGATGSFIGQPTIAGSRGGSVTIGTGNVSAASPSPSAAGNATLVGAGPSSSAVPSGAAGLVSPTASAAVVASPTASGAAVVSASPAASGAATASPAASVAASPARSPSPAASGAASIVASPAASGAASISASPAASGGAVIISPSPARSPSPVVSGAASVSASPAASGAASISASPAASGAATASPAASAAASGSPARSPSPAASSGVVASASPAVSGAASPAPSGTVSAGTVGSLFPAMPTYGEENFAFTCPNVTNQTMVEVSFEPLLVGIDAVSSIKFAGCPALMYVATRSGRVFEVTLNNDSSAVEQVRLILDLSGQIFTSQASGAGASASPGPAASPLSASPSASAPPSSSSSTSSSPDQPGLLGIAFPPDFASSGLFYVYFSAQPTSGGAPSTPESTTTPSAADSCADESTLLNHVNRLAEYRLNSSTGIATLSRNLLELRWPFANGNADNSLEFAPGTRLLFVGVGDGGSSFDPFENAQNPDVLLGKVHVLDLNSLSANASCNTTVLRLSELELSCPEIASATTIFATGMHAPAGLEFLSPPAESEGAACPSSGAANETASAGGASTNATSGGNNATLSSLAARVIVPDRGQGRYEEVNIMEQIGANYGWDILEGWSCVDQSLDLCPTATSGPATSNNASLAGGANATAGDGAGANATASNNATASGNATLAGGNNATSAANNTGLSTTSSVLPAAVIPHNCRQLYNPQAVLGGRLYRGTELNPLLQGAYLFGATSSLQNGDEALPIGSGGLYFMRPESFAGNAVVDLGMCPAAGSGSAVGEGSNATAAGGSNATAAEAGGASNATSAEAGSGITSTGSGVNASFIPNSRLEVFPVTANFQFFPTQHFFTAIGADASRTQLFVGVSSAETPTGGVAGVFRLIPFNEGPLNPAVISATNLTPGQIVFSAANATASASPSPSTSPASSAAASPAV